MTNYLNAVGEPLSTLIHNYCKPFWSVIGSYSFVKKHIINQDRAERLETNNTCIITLHWTGMLQLKTVFDVA